MALSRTAYSMVKATTCRLNGRNIDIADALALRQRGERITFRCRECGEKVRAHKKDATGQAAHFEHFTKNSRCSLSTRR